MISTVLNAAIAVALGRIFTLRHGILEWAAVSVVVFLLLRIFY